MSLRCRSERPRSEFARRVWARLRDRLCPGDPNDSLPRSFQKRLALGVVLACDLAVVPGRTVGFDDEMLAWPAKVGNDPAASDEKRLVDVGVDETARRVTGRGRCLRARCWWARDRSRSRPRADGSLGRGRGGRAPRCSWRRLTRFSPWARRIERRAVGARRAIAARSSRVRAGAVTGTRWVRGSVSRRQVVAPVDPDPGVTVTAALPRL